MEEEVGLRDLLGMLVPAGASDSGSCPRGAPAGAPVLEGESRERNNPTPFLPPSSTMAPPICSP